MDEDGNPVDAEKVDDIMYDENGDVIEGIYSFITYGSLLLNLCNIISFSDTTVNIGEDSNPHSPNAPPSKTLPIPPGSTSFFCMKDDNSFRIMCHTVANHPYFGNTVLVCILISSFLLATEDPVRPRARINEVFIRIFSSTIVLCSKW